MNNSECVMVFGIHVLEPSEIRPATEMGNSGEFPFQAGHRPPTAPGDIAGSCLPLGDPFWPCSRAILVHSGGRFSFRYAARHSRAPGGPRSPGAVPNALVRAQGSGGGGRRLVCYVLHASGCYMVLLVGKQDHQGT